VSVLDRSDIRNSRCDSFPCGCQRSPVPCARVPIRTSNSLQGFLATHSEPTHTLDQRHNRQSQSGRQFSYTEISLCACNCTNVHCLAPVRSPLHRRNVRTKPFVFAGYTNVNQRISLPPQNESVDAARPVDCNHKCRAALTNRRQPLVRTVAATSSDEKQRESLGERQHRQAWVASDNGRLACAFAVGPAQRTHADSFPTLRSLATAPCRCDCSLKSRGAVAQRDTRSRACSCRSRETRPTESADTDTGPRRAVCSQSCTSTLQQPALHNDHPCDCKFSGGGRERGACEHPQMYVTQSSQAALSSEHGALEPALVPAEENTRESTITHTVRLQQSRRICNRY
jgi:hypothetical protein